MNVFAKDACTIHVDSRSLHRRAKPVALDVWVIVVLRPSSTCCQVAIRMWIADQCWRWVSKHPLRIGFPLGSFRIVRRSRVVHMPIVFFGILEDAFLV